MWLKWEKACLASARPFKPQYQQNPKYIKTKTLYCITVDQVKVNCIWKLKQGNMQHYVWKNTLGSKISNSSGGKENPNQLVLRSPEEDSGFPGP
jgi:hypothetical protein